MKHVKIFALRRSQELGRQIAEKMGTELSELVTQRFSDGELSPHFTTTIRGQNVFIIGTLSQPHSNIMEMMLTIDAAKRSGAKTINCIMPYLAYARQDKKGASRSGIGARVMANMLEVNGADSVTIVDLHATQIEAAFNIPTVHITGRNVFIPKMKEVLNDDWVICSPDAGGTVRATQFSNFFNLPLAIIDKKRDRPNSIGSMILSGGGADVKGKNVMIIDDMIDTAGTLCKATDMLLDKYGAKSVSATITHPVLSGPAYKRIAQSQITKLYTSDTIALPDSKTFENEEIYVPKNKIEVVSCTTAIAKVTEKMISNSSVDVGLEELILEN